MYGKIIKPDYMMTAKQLRKVYKSIPKPILKEENAVKATEALVVKQYFLWNMETSLRKAILGSGFIEASFNIEEIRKRLIQSLEHEKTTNFTPELTDIKIHKLIMGLKKFGYKVSVDHHNGVDLYRIRC